MRSSRFLLFLRMITFYMWLFDRFKMWIPWEEKRKTQYQLAWIRLKGIFHQFATNISIIIQIKVLFLPSVFPGPNFPGFIIVKISSNDGKCQIIFTIKKPIKLGPGKAEGREVTFVALHC